MRRKDLFLVAIAFVWALTGCQATASRSSQSTQDERLVAYFNNPLAALPEMDNLKAQANGIDQALISLIDSASQSLNIAIYHLNLEIITEALERACGRGVRIRLLLEAQQSRPKRFPNCVQLKLARNERLMHHKFIIVDQHTVWTGSLNWTESSLYFDANNIVIIHSANVARAYESEFEEMFSHERYGPAKRDTNEERFKVNGIRIEVHFSPSDRPRQRLIALIENARESIRLAIFQLTDTALYEAILKARDRGVHVEAIWDFLSQDGCFFSKIDDLIKQGVGLFEAGPGLLHNKYAVIDDRIVITGSANWSNSGLEQNDENILILFDEYIAQLYRQDFQRILHDAGTYELRADLPPRVEVRHFGDARGAALIQWRPHALGVVERYEICRMRNAEECERIAELPGWAWYFIDREVAPGREYLYRVRSQLHEQLSPYSNIHRARVRDDIPLLTSEEAGRSLSPYEGKTVTVRFQVVNRPEPSRQGHIFLNAGQDYQTDFTAFIPACALERFTGSGLDLFGLQGQTLEVTGELRQFNGPEIIVTGPWQIRVK